MRPITTTMSLICIISILKNIALIVMCFITFRQDEIFYAKSIPNLSFFYETKSVDVLHIGELQSLIDQLLLVLKYLP